MATDWLLTPLRLCEHLVQHANLGGEKLELDFPQHLTPNNSWENHFEPVEPRANRCQPFHTRGGRDSTH